MAAVPQKGQPTLSFAGLQVADICGHDAGIIAQGRLNGAMNTLSETIKILDTQRAPGLLRFPGQ
jgi:hypothetical protein